MKDTIVASATPLARAGAVGIVKMSGENALELAKKVFSATSLTWESVEPNKMYLGEFSSGEIKDKAFCVYYKAPKSYTGEDVIEIQAHGGISLIKGIIRELVKLGARPAEPGEFTKRAYLNGKMNLAEAEGVQELINAEGELAVKQAYRLMDGELSRGIELAKAEILTADVNLESVLDYPEELTDDLSEPTINALNNARTRLIDIYNGSKNQHFITEGVTLAIAGLPNVGKSSLMNALMHEERAIVTDIAGTTRDVLRESCTLRGLKINLTDTAGIRESDDTVEKIGVERAKKAIEGADIVLFLMDSATPETPEEIELYKEISTKKHLRVENKEDIKSFPRVADISIEAKTGKGIEELIDMMFDKLDIEKIATAVPLTSERHLHAVKTAIEAIESAIDSFYVVPIDCTSVDVKSAYRALAELTGEDVDENIVNEIFSRFCVGK